MLTDPSEIYYQKLDSHIKNLVKDIETKLDSVRKERQNVITTIENIVKQTWSP